MSTRTELRTLIRLSPEVTVDTISNTNMDILFDKATIDLGLKGRALPRNEKVNLVADAREHVVSGASPILSKDDFLGIDLTGGGVLFNDGSRWVGPPEFEPKTREWLDLEDPGWRTRSASTATPLYWYLDRAEDNSDNLVVGLSEIPSASQTDRLWIHYLSRGTLMTGDTQFPWTGSTTQLVHLEPYEMLLVYYVLEIIMRLITKERSEADMFKAIYEAGAVAMAKRFPLADHLAREGFKAPGYFSNLSGGRSRL